MQNYTVHNAVGMCVFTYSQSCHRDRQAGILSHPVRHTEHKYRQTHKQTPSETDRQAGRQAGILSHLVRHALHTYRQTHKQIPSETDRQADRQAYCHI